MGGGLLSAIQGGAQLKKMEKPAASSSGGDMGGDLLSAIRGGKSLRKASVADRPPPVDANPGLAGLGAALASALAAREKVIQDDPDEEEDDDDWGSDSGDDSD